MTMFITSAFRGYAQTLKGVVAAVIIGSAASTAASAATVDCPGSSVFANQRTFSLTSDPTATCLGYGVGNESLADVQGVTGISSLVLIDKRESGGSEGVLAGTALQAITGTLFSGLSGSLSIAAPGYSNLVLVFKSGEGRLDPDWAAFGLDGDLTASWSISGQQELSHVSLYGTIAAVPLPASWLLLLAGLGGLSVLHRRKQML